jgi:LysR family carnitine catabolism transcriptional activator
MMQTYGCEVVDVNLRELQVFAAVARDKSFTAAAERLRLSQSALSRTVAGLEARLRVKLLERTTRSVELTAHGEALLAAAEHVLQAHRAAMSDLERHLAGERGTVTCATLPSVAAVLLPRVITAFHQRHPDIEVRILDGLASSVGQRVATGDADLAITVGNQVPARVDRQPFIQDRLFAALPPAHELARKSQVRWAELSALPFITLGTDSSVRHLTDAGFQLSNTSITNVLQASNVSSVGGLVAAGLGASAFPGLVRALTGFADIAHRPLIAPVIHRRLDLVTPAQRTPSPAVRLFLQLLHDLRADATPLPEGVEWQAGRTELG